MNKRVKNLLVNIICIIIITVFFVVFFAETINYATQSARNEYNTTAVYHRQGIIQTENGNFYEVDCALTPASEYYAIMDNNGTPRNKEDDFIIHLYEKKF